MSHKLKNTPVKILQILPSQKGSSQPSPFEPSPIQLSLTKAAKVWYGLPAYIADGSLCIQAAALSFSVSVGREARLLYQRARDAQLPERAGNLLESFKNARSWKMVEQCVGPPSRVSLNHPTPADAIEPSLRTASTMIENDDRHRAEFCALRDQLIAQQGELIGLTAQMTELKALVVSQQQVLLHFGKELDTALMKIVAAEAVAPKKSGSASVKSSKTRKAIPQKAIQKIWLPN